MQVYTKNDPIKFKNLEVIIKHGDISKFEGFDALVVPTNPMLYQEPGISSDLFKACGREKLAKHCKKIKAKENLKHTNQQIIKKKDNQDDFIDLTQFWLKENDQQNNEESDYKFQETSVIKAKSYGLKEKQKISNLLLVVEPENFDSLLIIKSIKNILFKAKELNLKKIGLPIICYHFENFEPKVWAVAYKQSFQQFAQENDCGMQIEIACHNENISYSFQRTFNPQEFVQISNQYITDILNSDIVINPINQNDPKFGVSGKILEKAGSNLELDIKSQIKKGKRWIMSDSYEYKQNKVKYILSYIGPIDKRISRQEKLIYFFDKILNICFVDYKVKSICIPLMAIPQAVFYKQEQNNFAVDRLSISLKDAINAFEDKGNKCGQIIISIMDDQMRQFCKSLFN